MCSTRDGFAYLHKLRLSVFDCSFDCSFNCSFDCSFDCSHDWATAALCPRRGCYAAATMSTRSSQTAHGLDCPQLTFNTAPHPIDAHQRSVTCVVISCGSARHLLRDQPQLIRVRPPPLKMYYARSWRGMRWRYTKRIVCRHTVNDRRQHMLAL